MLGLSADQVCGFASSVSCPSLLCGPLVVAGGRSPGMLLSELRTFIKRFGYAAQRRREPFGGLLRTTCCALSGALALHRLALVSGPLPSLSLFVALLALLEPTHVLARSVRLLLGSGLLALITEAVAVICHVLTVVGGSLSLIRDPFALIRDPVSLIRDPVSLIRGPLALVGQPFGHGRNSLLTTAPVFITQPVSPAL